MVNNLLLCYHNNKNFCAYVQLELKELESKQEVVHDISDLLVDVCGNRLYILYIGLTMSLSCTLINPQNQKLGEIMTSCSFSKNTIAKDEE